ncbi:protein FAR-RED IMPAIRED RESPONSE 1-like [Nicotiana tabacum]|uniref:Protein FAR-RED IMPAIRED RESPONSE 1-like n=1 Tax=Nicotiana tabacum TaxID=4097 RepID=A0AC58T414_TOBAC
MGGIAPKTIITDQIQAMAIAIREVMSGTRHGLCQWHISHNAPSHLGPLKNDKGYSKLFNKCMSECDSITEFEKMWEMMLTMHNVEEQKWLKNLYNIRQIWSTTFNNDVFSVGLKATSRSESTNHVLNGLGDLSTYLHIFVTNYKKNIVNKWRLSEEHEDFKCKQGKPTPTVKGSPILTQISAVYTHKIYNMFEKEFLKEVRACFIEVQVYCDGQVSKYEVRTYNSSKSWFVELDPTTLHVTCTCNKFESMGILCAHCLLIYSSNKVCEIPKEYILRRWTKDVRKRIKNLPSQSCSMNRSSESEIIYTNSVMQTCYNLTHLRKYSVER